MRNRQNRIILILAGLVLFSSSLALLMYSKQAKVVENIEEKVEVYAAAGVLHKGDIIAAKDITTVLLPKSYLAFAPLTQSEIIGRYAQVDIFAKEPFRSEKIALVAPSAEALTQNIEINSTAKEEQTQSFLEETDTIALSLSLFKNIDPSLKQGDFIDIVSIKGDSKTQQKEMEFSTQYIALQVEIEAFVSQSAKVKNYKNAGEKGQIIVADSVVLKISPENLKNFFALYYKTQELNANRVYNDKNSNVGHLWMVKCAKENDTQTQAKKIRMMHNYAEQTQVAVKAKVKTQEVKISYEN